MSDIKWNETEFNVLWKDKNLWLQENGNYNCPICGKEYPKGGIKNHLKISHFGYPHSRGTLGKRAWNKGLTKDTDERVFKAGKTLINNIKSGKVIPHMKGKNLSAEHKLKISKMMKLAHKEGRAWNIGISRWNNKKSHPEKFFTEVIENNFLDKNYINEFPFYKYSLDFVWPHLKKCIEIDGDQHYRFKEYINRDIEKNKLLEENGWKVLRIRWKNIYNDVQKYIQITKDFIEKDIIHLEDNLLQYQTECEEIKKLKCAKENKKINDCYDIAVKVNKLIDSDIDFNKFGWVTKVNNYLNIVSSRKWIKRWCPWLLEGSYIRNKTEM